MFDDALDRVAVGLPGGTLDQTARVGIACFTPRPHAGPREVDVLGVVLGVEPGRQQVNDMLKAVASQIASMQLLQGTALAGAPVLAVSALTGDGLPALRELLLQWQRAALPRPVAGGFRLVIDRCFTRPGAGVVVTGTVLSGSAQRDDSLCLTPGGQAVRVRAHGVERVFRLPAADGDGPLMLRLSFAEEG